MLIESAKYYLRNGFSVMPARYADKQPTLPWKRFQSVPMSEGEAEKLFQSAEALGVITGSVSKNLEVIDVDDAGLWPKIWDKMQEEFGDVFPVVRTRRGYHVWYRCAEIAGNMKLAVEDKKTLIETRGEGGYVMAPPSENYSHLNEIYTPPQISAHDRTRLLEIMRSFDKREKQPEPVKKNGDSIPVQNISMTVSPSEYASARAGDDYDAKISNEDVLAMLQSHGWTVLQTNAAGGVQLARPGVDHVSATFNVTADSTGRSVLSERRFYVFSSNAHPFEMNSSYSPFGVYTLLNHAGDFKRAAQALSEQGYGAPAVSLPFSKLNAHVETPQQVKNANEKQSVLDTLKQIVVDVTYFKDPQGRLYAEFPVDGGTEIAEMSRGSRLNKWIQNKYHDNFGKLLPSTSLAEFTDLLKSIAEFNAPTKQVFLRLGWVMGQNGKPRAIYYDLANDRGEVVEIDTNGWRIIANPPVKFRRAKGFLPVPQPKSGGKIDDIFRFLNVQDDRQRMLLVGWLVGTLMPNGPYMHLFLNGEAGSAKSTATRLVRSLIDPNEAATRIDPKDIKSFILAGHNGWIPAYDNLSRMPDWLSDVMCCMSTGAAISDRKLYTDDEEVLFSMKRPIVFNGITNLIHRQDLLSRTLSINLEYIPPEKRLIEADFEANFEQARPKILGALFDAVSAAIRNLPKITGPFERMADFQAFAEASGEAFGWENGAFSAALRNDRAESLQSHAENDPFVELLLQFVDSVGGAICMRPAQLHEQLRLFYVREHNSERMPRWMPQAPNSLAGKIKRAGAGIRAIGCELRDSKIRGNSYIEVKKINQTEMPFQAVLLPKVGNFYETERSDDDAIPF